MLDLLASSIIAVFTGLLSVPTPAATPIGLWQHADASIEARFYPCGDKLCARVTAAKASNRSIRSGTMLVQNAALTSHNMWEGRVLDVDNGNVVAGVITLHSRDTLNLKSCTALVFCRIDTWNRVN
ncbi:DUF2147 domain-containing protein [Undibacter mobilis]|uniref:DUF2147 domain-containing protein n=1 Tax=Undibacter mobilis TaxID=2292256 RepID=A0A371B8X6_9BRAD|nr:DUF2147 domain-containing protein [Undibacter mobilis]RDV04038.1 DUF2147 domain-containing protein [Undibacter mobilis]